MKKNKRIFIDDKDRPIPLNISKEILEIYPIITLKDNEQLMYFNNGIYHDGAYTLIKEESQKLVPFIPKRYKEEVIELIKGLTYIDRKKLNEEKDFIPVKNGIYNLKTEELLTPNPDIFLTRELPIFYDPFCDCPKIKKFIEQLVGKDQINLVQELFGYCLINDYPFNKAFMLFGCGRNGKSTFLNLMLGFLGEDNINSASLQDLCYNRFAKKDLFGKIANIYDDLPNSELKQTGNFKILTGKGRVYADVKFKDHFEFTNTAKLIFSCNELPPTTDTTDAFFRRWNIIKFGNIFDGDEVDTSLPYSIMDDNEMSGLFNWALKGLKRLLKQNGFSASGTTEDIKEEWILQTDPMRAFISKNIEYSPKEHITKDEFSIALNEFCIDHNSPEITKQKIGQRLPAILPKMSIGKEYIEGKQERVWKGITFINRGKKLDKTHKTDIQAFLYSSRNKNNILNEDLKKLGLLSCLSQDIFTKDNLLESLKENKITGERAEKTIELWLKRGIIFEFKPNKFKFLKQEVNDE